MNTKCLLYTAKGDDCWGNAISWDNPLVNEVGKIQNFHGWKQRRPEVNDFIEIPMKSGKNFLFKVVECEHCKDPNDMFFAKGEFLGYKEDQENFQAEPESTQKVMFFR